MADLAQIVPRLPLLTLHRAIEARGLEDSAELVALATPSQLARMLDADLWRARSAGGDEAFDADRFTVWVSVLLQCGPGVAAEKIAALDIDLVIAGYIRHAKFYDLAAAAPYMTLDGTEMPGRPMQGAVSEIAGYVVDVRHQSSGWDAMAELLAVLSEHRPDYFHRLMRGCIELSDDAREPDGCDDLLDAAEQDALDLAVDREGRRELEGFVSPAQAQAFLQEARRLSLAGARPPRSAVVQAYFRALEPRRGDSQDDAAALEVLGVPVDAQARALLGAGDTATSHLALLEAHVLSHPGAGGELAYLANVVVAGGVVQGRAFTPREAGQAVSATCNLGLENWPRTWADPDLVTAFQIGRTILHCECSTYTASRLSEILSDVRCSDSDIQVRLTALRHELIRRVHAREPWRARDALDVILMLDTPCWAALNGLLDEWPVLHAALAASRKRCPTIDPAAFEFIAANRDLDAVRVFVESLPDALMS